MSKLVGVWNLVESENWDEYLKTMGVGYITRKAAGTIKPTLTISNEGNNWTLKLTSTFKNSETNFTDGVAFDENTLDGRKSSNVIKYEGEDKLVQEQTIEQIKNHIIREIVGDRLVQTLTANGVVCKRIYARA